MAEGKVRLVRCPKCERVLPELPDYSVYQCGGCGAVLRAKVRNSEVDTLSNKSHEEIAGQFIEKFQNFPDKEIVNPNDAADENVKLTDDSFRSEQKVSENDDVQYAEECRNAYKFTVDKWVVENDFDMNMRRGELGNLKMGSESGDLKSQAESVIRSRRLGDTADGKIGERGGMESFQRTLRTDVEGVRFSTSNYLDEGPSNSYYSYGEPLKNLDNPGGSSRDGYLQQDRAEILRKLDELKDQLSRSCDVADKPKDKVPQNGRMAHHDSCGGSSNTWFPDGSLGLDGPSVPFCVPDKHVTEPPYFTQCPESYPFMNRHGMAMHGLYPSVHTSNNIPVYGDPYGSQMLKTAPPQAPYHYHRPSHRYFSGQYMDNDLDPYAPYSRNAFLHQPSCSCFHCYGKHRDVPGPVPPTTFGNKRFADIPSDPRFYRHEKPSAFGPRFYNPSSANPPLNSCNPHIRWPSDINSEMGGFVHCHPHRVVVPNAGRRCHPVAGGAPFITCCNCFELLQLPKKVLLLEKNQGKLQCGACSTIISFAIVNKKFVVSPHAETQKASSEVNEHSNNAVFKAASHSRGLFKRSENFYSDDSGYDFQSMDREPISSSTGQGFGSSKSQDMQSIHSSSISTSEGEDYADGLIAPRGPTNTAELPVKANSSPPPPGSPLQEHFDYSSNNYAVGRFVKGNLSTRSDQEKVTLSKTTSRQNSVKDMSLATEMEVPFNEYLNTGTSQDSVDVSGEEDKQRINRGGESFFAGIIKKSFRDLSRSSQTVEGSKSNVTINGHLIRDRVVRKAEKLAGPIHPGQYWYDFQAGFWGVMGGPCLGIIPPFIEEFNYPMPENCAGGNTGVFVNGRELHQKDLDLLSSRGLPSDRDRSYIIEISGKVLDEDSGEELDSLGKLAPTVEKVKHGFGMKALRAPA
ncbi:protein ENHANCED DISEASE RESISTANCE 4-like [Malania oleifera]|uniref:protein ENHANCED DISEASE RESISTANCE 4-like n=1 Tax=Malania oleifera TaxID=397392 RepID=UPI0025AE29D9|nr:protein ENHANCED DISEASE RESISTANCE 4-like [Malania oleifera]